MAEGHDSKQAREAFEAAEQHKNNPVPGAEQGSHAKSHAAHLHAEGDVKTSPEGYGKQGREPGTQNQPPQSPLVNGKAHHRQ